MTRRPLPTRKLPEHPNLDQLKRQAKELLDAFRSEARRPSPRSMRTITARTPARLRCMMRSSLSRAHLLKSTPLGWACRWGQAPLVRLFLERGADPVEPDAEPWATPLAWTRQGGHDAIEAELLRATRS